MPAVVGKAAVGYAAVGISIPVGSDAARAVILPAAGAPFAIWSATRIALWADTHAVADGNAFSRPFAKADGRTDDLVTETAGVNRRALEQKFEIVSYETIKNKKGGKSGEMEKERWWLTHPLRLVCRSDAQTPQ